MHFKTILPPNFFCFFDKPCQNMVEKQFNMLTDVVVCAKYTTKETMNDSLDNAYHLLFEVREKQEP